MRFLYGLRVSVKCDAKETCFAKKYFCFEYLYNMNTIS